MSVLRGDLQWKLLIGTCESVRLMEVPVLHLSVFESESVRFREVSALWDVRFRRFYCILMCEQNSMYNQKSNTRIPARCQPQILQQQQNRGSTRYELKAIFKKLNFANCGLRTMEELMTMSWLFKLNVIFHENLATLFCTPQNILILWLMTYSVPVPGIRNSSLANSPA